MNCIACDAKYRVGDLPRTKVWDRSYFCSEKCNKKWDRERKETALLSEKLAPLYELRRDIRRDVEQRLWPGVPWRGVRHFRCRRMKTTPKEIEDAIRAVMEEKKKFEITPGLHMLRGTIVVPSNDVNGFPSRSLQVPELLLTPPEPMELTGFSPREKLIGATNWKKLRAIALERYGAVCMICGGDNRAIEMHEVYSYDFYERIADVHEFLLTCKACHAFIHLRRLSSRVSQVVISDTIDHGHKVLVRAGIISSVEECDLVSSIDPIIAAQLARRSSHRGITIGTESPTIFGGEGFDWLTSTHNRSRVRLCFKDAVNPTSKKPWRLRYRGDFVDYLPVRTG